VSDKISLY